MFFRLKQKNSAGNNLNSGSDSSTNLSPNSLETLAAALEMRQLAAVAYKLPFDLNTERGLYNAYYNRAESVYDNIDEIQQVAALQSERFGSVPPPYDSTSKNASQLKQ